MDLECVWVVQLPGELAASELQSVWPTFRVLLCGVYLLLDPMFLGSLLFDLDLLERNLLLAGENALSSAGVLYESFGPRQAL